MIPSLSATSVTAPEISCLSMKDFIWSETPGIFFAGGESAARSTDGIRISASRREVVRMGDECIGNVGQKSIRDLADDSGSFICVQQLRRSITDSSMILLVNVRQQRSQRARVGNSRKTDCLVQHSDRIDRI